MSHIQTIVAESNSYIRDYIEVNGPDDLSPKARKVLDHYIRRIAEQGYAVVRETVQATAARTGIGVKAVRRLRNELVSRGRIEMKQTGRATEITVIDIRLPFSEPVYDPIPESAPSWSPSIANQIVNLLQGCVLIEVIPDLATSASSDLAAKGSPGESKEEKSPEPPKEESKKLDSSNLVVAQEPPRTKKARKSDPKPRAVQPHIAIIDSWYEHSDPLFRPAVKSYNRYVKAARALDKAGYTAAEVGAFIDAQQRPYQEWAKLKALSTPKGKTPPPMIMGLEYITQHIAEFAADIRQKARAEAEYQDALRVQNEMRAAMGLTPQAA